MRIFEEIDSIKNEVSILKCKSKKIGLVPTMGALHEGHAALIKRALVENDYTICSIFVNPVQFNNPDDFRNYPSNHEKDLLFLKELGCHLVFMPSSEIMYPVKPVVYYNFGDLEVHMEGLFRKGHFNGVGLVVSKLFNIIMPDTAYFGQKDLQQYLIVEKLVRDLNFNVKLVCMPIVREKSGLAISSRNAHLNKVQKELAANLFKSLTMGKEIILNGGSAKDAKTGIKNFLSQWGDMTIDYIELVDTIHLKIIENPVIDQEIALCLAVYVKKVRLIDNVIFKK